MTGEAMKRRVSRALALSVAAVIAMVSFAWACSPQPNVVGLSLTGPPQSTVVIQGSGFQTAGGGSRDSEAPAPVTISWNSLGGPQLAVAYASSDGGFSVPVTVPNVEPGVYFLVASLGGLGVARTPYEVVAGPDAAGQSRGGGDVSADLWRGLAPGSSDLGPSAVGANEPSSSAPITGFALFGLGAIALAACSTIFAARYAKRRSIAL